MTFGSCASLCSLCPWLQVLIMVPCFDPSKVKCSGPGLERATAGEAGQFHVDCSSAGSAELTIEIRSEAGLPAEVHIQDHGDGTHTITYIPLCPGAYTVTIKYGGQPVPNFPSKLQVEPAVDTSGIQCYGPGIEGQGARLCRGTWGGGTGVSGAPVFLFTSPPPQVSSEKPPPSSAWMPGL